MSAQPDAPATPKERIFLVVVDATEEMRAALRYACRRARHTGGRVALLAVLDPVEFQHWLGVGRVMEAEQRLGAEQRLTELGAEVQAISGATPAFYIREGEATKVVCALIEEEPNISVLVLGTAPGSANPGPLVSKLVAAMGSDIRVPITLVPGSLALEAIDAVA